MGGLPDQSGPLAVLLGLMESLAELYSHLWSGKVTDYVPLQGGDTC